MSVRIVIHHRSEYHYDRLVNLSLHTIRLKAAPHTRRLLHHFSQKVEPEQNYTNWQQDHTGGQVLAAEESLNPDFAWTLNLRSANKVGSK